MVSFNAFSGQIGKAICFKAGGILFEKGSFWPFVMIGGCSFAFVFFIIVMTLLGFLDKPIEKPNDVEAKSNDNPKETDNLNEKINNEITTDGENTPKVIVS